MLTIIPDVLTPSQIQNAVSMLASGQFVDGRLSAGSMAKQVKNNEELKQNSALLERLNAIVMSSLVQHPLFQAVTHPLRIASPFYARYGADKSYGDHVDDPVMGPPGGQYRTDVSTTVFLNEPEEYEGGELVINTPFRQQSVKLAAGSAVVYPSSSLHHVNKVRAGTRLVAVTWIQSMVRSPEKRELLYTLYQARESLLKSSPDSVETAQVDQSYVNLVRMWAEI
ncbi:MAG: Fe2+-dependent dioxygenase [Gammaproteobacteria bacterium]